MREITSYSGNLYEQNDAWAREMRDGAFGAGRRQIQSEAHAAERGRRTSRASLAPIAAVLLARIISAADAARPSEQLQQQLKQTRSS